MRPFGGAIARSVLAMAGRRSPWGSGNGDGEGKAGDDAGLADGGNGTESPDGSPPPPRGPRNPWLPPGDGPPPGQAGHDRLKSRRLVPFSTTGHRRLHALQWLAAYGVPDARRAATTLAAETTATFAERAAASRIKARR